MLTEFGGLSVRPEADEQWRGYATVGTSEALLASYEMLVSAVLSSHVLMRFCYTQLTDTGQETYGLRADRTPKSIRSPSTVARPRRWPVRSSMKFINRLLYGVRCPPASSRPISWILLKHPDVTSWQDLEAGEVAIQRGVLPQLASQQTEGRGGLRHCPRGRVHPPDLFQVRFPAFHVRWPVRRCRRR